ncbi:MAG: low specificity L-threonine aldolase [Actinomyces sp.]|nr:MAG: low specificity L-threonine aldolase [Actinomyces sp.]
MIDLGSDTATRPTPGMRRAMAEAEVGDEQRGEDPTTNRLQERVAELCGTEAALFLASGSLCNKVAVAALTRPGDSVLCDHRAHLYRWEAGGPAVTSGVMFDPVATDDGHFTAEQVRSRLQSGSKYVPRTALVALEQTHNFAGGTVWPLERYEAVCDAAHAGGASVLVDGARLLNAVVATGVPAHVWAAPTDAIWVDFSKGLGGPFGAALAGDGAFIEEAVRFQYVFGAALRQSGVIAAAALYALDHHVDRLAEDHARARTLAEGLAELGCRVADRVDTNLVYFDPTPAGLAPEPFCAALLDEGVRMGPVRGSVRAVTHLDIDDADITAALAAAARVLAAA